MSDRDRRSAIGHAGLSYGFGLRQPERRRTRSDARTYGSITELAPVVHTMLAPLARERAALVGLSGIDGSGKSRLALVLADELSAFGLQVALIGVDAWQNPQTIRFGGADRGPHFYEHCIRFDDLFAQLVQPLTTQRSIRLETKAIRTDRDVWDDVRLRLPQYRRRAASREFCCSSPRSGSASTCASGSTALSRRRCAARCEGTSNSSPRRSCGMTTSTSTTPHSVIICRRTIPRSAADLLLNNEVGI